jgi:hypothetical protein
MNVTLSSALSGAPVGTWCFALGGGIDPSTATVVASIVKRAGPYTHNFSLESAEWIANAPDCPPNEIEIRTLGYTVEGGNLVAVPDREIAFSFVVP